MRVLRASIAPLVLTLLLGGCASFPTKQLSVNFTNETVPIMLTPMEGGKQKTLEFEAGYATSMTSASTSNASGTMTMTMSTANNLGAPLATQLNNTLVLDPKWVQVRELEFKDNYFILGALYTVERTTYTTHVSLGVPAEGAQK